MYHRKQCFSSDLSGFQRLVHAVKLGEDGSAGPVPFPWSHQTVLVGCDWPPKDLPEQRVVCKEQPKQTGAHPDLSC